MRKNQHVCTCAVRGVACLAGIERVQRGWNTGSGDFRCALGRDSGASAGTQCIFASPKVPAAFPSMAPQSAPKDVVVELVGNL